MESPKVTREEYLKARRIVEEYENYDIIEEPDDEESLATALLNGIQPPWVLGPINGMGETNYGNGNMGNFYYVVNAQARKWDNLLIREQAEVLARLGLLK